MNLSLNTFRISLAREIKRGRAVRALYLKFENFEFKSRSNPASATVVVLIQPLKCACTQSIVCLLPVGIFNLLSLFQ